MLGNRVWATFYLFLKIGMFRRERWMSWLLRCLFQSAGRRVCVRPARRVQHAAAALRRGGDGHRADGPAAPVGRRQLHGRRRRHDVAPAGSRRRRRDGRVGRRGGERPGDSAMRRRRRRCSAVRPVPAAAAAVPGRRQFPAGGRFRRRRAVVRPPRDFAAAVLGECRRRRARRAFDARHRPLLFRATAGAAAADPAAVRLLPTVRRLLRHHVHGCGTPRTAVRLRAFVGDCRIYSMLEGA